VAVKKIEKLSVYVIYLFFLCSHEVCCIEWKSTKCKTLTTNKFPHYSITEECIRPSVSLKIAEMTEKQRK
jgi:hypothetical protein